MFRRIGIVRATRVHRSSSCQLSVEFVPALLANVRECVRHMGTEFGGEISLVRQTLTGTGMIRHVEFARVIQCTFSTSKRRLFYTRSYCELMRQRAPFFPFVTVEVYQQKLKKE